MEVEPLDSKMSETSPNRVREVSLAGSTGSSARSARLPWPISRRPGAAQKLDFADAKRREVIVQHEFLEVLAEERVDPLLVRGGALTSQPPGLEFRRV